MEKRFLGRSGLQVSTLSFGLMTFGGGGMFKDVGNTQVEEARRQIDIALEAGVTLFDTADIYSGGASETILAEALGEKRGKVLIATKVYGTMGKGDHERGLSRQHIVAACEASLKRLNTDYIDLYQMHSPDKDTPVEETLGALDDLVTQGKVRYLGNSNFTGWQIADADWIARNEHMNRFVSAQNNYSLLERKVEFEVTPACERFGLGVLPFFPLASGLLTGKYRRGKAPPEGTRLAAWGARGAAALNDKNFDRLEALSAYAEARDHDLLDLAFAWLLGHGAVSSVIAGATKPEQVKANAGAASWKLTPEEVTEVAGLAD